MRFDFISFLIGFVSAAGVAFILYRMRSQIMALRKGVEKQAESTGQFFSNSAEVRYAKGIIELLNQYHIAGDVVPLKDIYVEPRFLPPPEMVDPSSERVPTVFHVVPQIHDFPASYAPYNVPSLTINDLRGSDRHLALLGLPGSGKSTALAVLGLVAVGEIEIPVIDLMNDPSFEEELKSLSPDDREKKIKSREELQRRAMAQLAQAQEKEKEKEKDKEKRKVEKRPLIDFKTLLPVLVHLRDIDLRPEAYGGTADVKNARPLDPAEPVVAALQKRIGGVIASFVPKVVYSRLQAGTALVLIDGFDEVAPSQRSEKLEWLARFIETYRANYIVVAGPESGFDPLVNIGLTPCFIRGWSDADYEALAHRWQIFWLEKSKDRRSNYAAPDERVTKRVGVNNRGRLPLDVTLKIWAAFSGDEKEQGRRGWYDFYVRRFLPNPEHHPYFGKLAATMLDADGAPLNKDRLKELITGLATGPDGKISINIDEMIGKIPSNPLIVTWPGDQYTFSHPLIGAFMAAEALTEQKVGEVAMKTAWNMALPFAAMRLPMDTAVMARLNAPSDLLYQSLFGMVYWLLDSPASAAWRGEPFKRLAAALLSPSQYPRIRERAMAALVASRDRGVLFVFKQALGSSNPLVRQLGCIGLGALGETEPIKDLEPMLGDSDPDVQLSAGLALAAIGTDKALETMVHALVSGEPSLRRAVAEALAAIPGVGHATLREAIAAPDMMMRYAAVFGLARVQSAWALSLLYQTLLQDEQWYVRNAAEQAFKSVEREDTLGLIRHPEADSLDWLIAWAADKGEGVPAGPNSRQMLIRALQEGEPDKRAAAALTLANLGHMQALKPLYSALKDNEETVRAAVFDSLAQLQTQLGQNLPNPV